MTDFLSVSETQFAQPGQVVVDVGGNIWKTWANAMFSTGSTVGVLTSVGIPGGAIQVVVAGRIPYALFNLGAGVPTSIVAGPTPFRGSVGTIIGTCDASGSIIILPTLIGGPPTVTTVATALGLLTVDPPGVFPNGSVAYVTSPGSYWTLVRSDTVAPDNLTRVAANGGGNWVLQDVLLGALQFSHLGGKSDVRTVSDASVNLGTPTLINSPTLNLTSADVGKIFLFPGAGTASGVLQAAVSLVSSSTSFISTVPASTAVVSGGSLALGTDNGPALTPACLAASRTGLPLVILGQMMFGNGAPAWDHGTVLSDAQSTWYAHLPGTGGDDDPTASIFFNPVTGGTGQVLSANAAVGAMSVQVASLPTGLTTTSKNVQITLTQGAFSAAGCTYIVRSVTGSGPFTLNLDRALELPYTTAASSQVAVEASVNYFTIDLGGATVTGPGGRYFESFESQHWRIRNVHITDVWGIASSPMSMEQYNYDTSFENIEVEGFGGDQISNGEHCYRRNVNWTRAGAGGLSMQSCVDSWLVDCATYGCMNAAGAVAFNAAAVGTGIPHNSGCIRSTFVGNNTGVIANAGDGLLFDACAFIAQTGPGLVIGQGIGPVVVRHNHFRNNGDTALSVNQNVVGLVIEGNDFNGNTPDVTTFTSELTLFSSAVVRDNTFTCATNNNAFAVLVSDASGGTVTTVFEGNNISRGSDNGSGLVLEGTAPIARWVGGNIICPGSGGSGITDLATGGSLYVERAKITATTGISMSNGPSLVIGPGVDLSGCATQLSIGTGGAAVVQQGGVAALSTTTGTAVLTLAQLYCLSWEITGNLSGNVIYQIPDHLFGYDVDVYCNSSALNGHTIVVQTVSGTGVTVSANNGKHQRLRVTGPGGAGGSNNVVAVTAAN